MAWTTPRTWATSEIVTAAMMNTHVRDNLNALDSSRQQCIVTKATQSITTGVNTDVLFDTEVVDTDSMHSTVTNTQRVTCTVAGVYVVSGYVNFDSHATGYRRIGVVQNDAGITYALVVGANVADAISTTVQMSTSGIASMIAGDFIHLNVSHTAGVSLNVTECRLALSRIG